MYYPQASGGLRRPPAGSRAPLRGYEPWWFLVASCYFTFSSNSISNGKPWLWEWDSVRVTVECDSHWLQWLSHWQVNLMRSVTDFTKWAWMSHWVWVSDQVGADHRLKVCTSFEVHTTIEVCCTSIKVRLQPHSGVIGHSLVVSPIICNTLFHWSYSLSIIIRYTISDFVRGHAFNCATRGKHLSIWSK